ncbi:MAG TPA: relaxase/mobilization nuclease domain-containing protein [Puia sp.]|nr:relaxase/mobilization nuclease domain-containing protein [Puia sp.]
MLSKVFITSKTFKQTCQYVCQDLVRSEVLAVEGVRGHDHRLMAEDFEVQHQFWPEKEKPVFHAALTFPHEERLGNAQMVLIARQYLDEIGMRNTQYAIVKHVDKQHLHMHIIANRIDNDGEIIGKGLIVERGIKAARKLTREHHLQQEHRKNLHLTNMEALREPDAKRYKLYQAIRRNLPQCYRLEDLEKKLLQEGITVRYRQDPMTGQRQGISFRIENYSIAGYRVDPSCTLRKLEEALSLQQEQVLKEYLGLKQGAPRPEDLQPKQENRLEEESIHRHKHRLRLRL